MRKKRKPLIGLNADFESGRFVLPPGYQRCVVEAGGVPVVLVPAGNKRNIKRQVELLDGLILTGCNDYRPALYGKRRHRALRLVIPLKERFDLALCREALRRDLPILGICGGMQLLNIVLGGPLLLHVRGHKKTQHAVRVEPGSLLASILGTCRLRVNSYHHQALEQPGRGLRAVGYSTDGLIEAVEAPGKRFVIGVQWHPERLKSKSTERLFGALVKAAASGED